MKKNQNLAKKVVLAASLTAGLIGVNSVFNETQASGWCWGTFSTVNGIAVCSGTSFNCTHPC